MRNEMSNSTYELNHLNNQNMHEKSGIDYNDPKLYVQVVFAGFSAESLAQRIVDCKPKVVITCNAVRRGPKTIFLKDIVDIALAQSAQNVVHI
ncbi:Acetyl-coenzyme A synthetase, cytoplasmic, partial [Datura stramonium]|nr:Acetyl-coenzyme A synthetase, cytoplasmic [Datura stramonium]